MIVGMVADAVSRIVDGASDLRPRARILADQKECGLGSVLGQQIEQMQRVGIVRSVVIGERHLPGIAAVSQRPTVKLRARRHAGVSGVAGCGRSGESCYKCKHSCDPVKLTADSRGRSRIERQKTNTWSHRPAIAYSRSAVIRAN